jgi:hypothetical protein
LTTSTISVVSDGNARRAIFTLIGSCVSPGAVATTTRQAATSTTRTAATLFLEIMHAFP